MNLAIEYAIRSGAAINGLTFPFTLFVTEFTSDRRVVVWVGRDGDALLVRHWRVGDFHVSAVLPPYNEHWVRMEDILTSVRIVIPRYEMLPYHQEPYDPRSSPRLATEAEARGAYEDMANRILNSRRHVEAREEWLWSAFTESFGVMGHTTRLEAFRRMPTRAASIWGIWRRTLLDVGPAGRHVASELVFTEPYRRGAVAAGALSRPSPVRPHDEPCRWLWTGH